MRNKMGRNGKYDEDFPSRAEDFARQGMIDDDIAKALGIHRATFYKYQNLYSDFSDALKKGRAPIDFEVENKLLKRAQGYEYEEVMIEYKPGKDNEGKDKPKATLIKKTVKQVIPDTTAQIFWLKNRRKKLWRERHEHAVGGSEDMPAIRYAPVRIEEKKEEDAGR